MSTRTENLRFAVVDGPDGTDAREAPYFQDDAVELRLHHRNQFWCSTQAGGCGKPMELAAGKIVVPYFRHKVVGHCNLVRTGGGGDAYFHLAYQLAIAAWLDEQGYRARIERTFPDGGGRADLHVTVEGVSHSIEVQLSQIPAEAWRARTERYQAHVDHVTWLHGPSCSGTLTADRVINDLALAIRTNDGAVEIGVHWGPDATEWSALDTCRMRPDGIWTPHLDEVRAALARAAEERARAQREAAEQEAEERARAKRAAAERAETDRIAGERQSARVTRIERAREREAAQSRPHVAPMPLRTFEEWESLHPEMGPWAVTERWDWLNGFTESQQRAGRWIAYVVRRLYSKAMVGDLRHPELDEEQFIAVVNALLAAGLATLESPDAATGRWVRA